MKNFSLKAKLLSLSLFLITISIVIGGVSYWSVGSVIKEYSVISDISYPNTSAMLQMFSNYRSSRIEASQLISPNVPADVKKNVYELMEKNLELDKTLDKKYLEQDYLPGEEALYLEFRKTIDEANKDFKQIMQMYKENKTDAASLATMVSIVNGKLGTDGVQARITAEKLREFHENQALKSEDEAKDAGASATKLTVMLILIFGVIGFVTAFTFSNMLTATLKAISDALDDSSTQVSSAAGQIAASSQELSQAVTEQASSLEETSSSVEEMSSMVNVNTENAKKASENSGLSKRQAERGRTVVEEMVQSMSLINDSNNNIMNQINKSNEQMGEIVKVIQEIETKTKVINDIVFQTKLLSFNASVEAARAGEQGKGFAVVAEEVGNLAQMSGNAAKEISEMLASSVHKVEAIVHETRSSVDGLIADGKEKVRNGTKVAEECGEVLAEIVANVSNVATMANEISVASDEQSKGIQEITKAMGQLDQVTQTNAQTSEQAAHSAEQLSVQAVSLKDQVVTLVAVINGNGKNIPVVTKVKTKTETHTNTKTPPKASNVLPMKKAPAPKPAAKVVSHAPVATPKKAAAGINGGKAVGNLPSYDHPGFEDV
ncbi:methyl-accepting chemotaxis protein [Bacteriovorax sp. PP10]|uniref:Methyl-accepting chemotaxis protein n=1 Tax=Bacteriovorax antarcticus TaxID=3088717 RepID=A0ABU5VWI7_9BACT|nr:methyl-accepting chemotaxis protein [Bacteriovorax sp. PP10]MEA9356957.1 methyl-accepting chemotaxis protein [Bacteriovorax sp. PP10]